MKIKYGFLICLLLTLLLSVIVPSMKIADGAISTLYTVSGIMFSIGMSLTVMSNTAGVKNKAIRLRIRAKIKQVRNKFIVCFGIVSAIYIAMALIPEKMETCFMYIINMYWLLLTTLLFSIIYFIVNFTSIQSLNEEIEEALNEEI